ncbi:MAG: hypothetical protein IH849_09800 [Acidobacteria bacterium]|nr:hypothetical protein [Acidobacteriota bacterium]
MQRIRPPAPLIFVLLAALACAATPEALSAECATHRVEYTEDEVPTVFRIEPAVVGLEY